MNLQFLLREAGVAPAKTDAEITCLTRELSGVRPGTLFLSFEKDPALAADAAARAIASGAQAVLGLCPVPGAVFVPELQKVSSLLWAAFTGHPERSLELVGITGTNGKTTTAQYLRHFLSCAGKKSGVIGTLGAELGDETIPTGYTTPPPEIFFPLLQKAKEKGIGTVIAEVSSIALSQYRVDGARFRLGLFTNLGRDHLDVHRTQERLLEAKTRLCSLSREMLVNLDDAYADRFPAPHGRTYGCSVRGRLCDFSVRNLYYEGFGSEGLYFDSKEVYPIRISAPGEYSAQNVLLALAAAELLGADPAVTVPAAARLPAVPGRAERLQKNGTEVVIDFAHTPEAIWAVLWALKKDCPGRLIAVFGAGGERDRGKRPLMGAAAAAAADELILTSDNPRGEDPEEIIAEIASGVPRKTPVFKEPDRAQAIRLALKKAQPGDVVAILGKGHETSQILKTGAVPFLDRETVLSC